MLKRTTFIPSCTVVHYPYLPNEMIFFIAVAAHFFLSHDINSVKQQICGILMRQREVPGVNWKYL